MEKLFQEKTNRRQSMETNGESKKTVPGEKEDEEEDRGGGGGIKK